MLLTLGDTEHYWVIKYIQTGLTAGPKQQFILDPLLRNLVQLGFTHFLQNILSTVASVTSRNAFMYLAIWAYELCKNENGKGSEEGKMENGK